MALPKTVSYVPFEETSFGYGSTELATNYATEFPNGTDIVKIIIEHSSGNWDTTGHLSTPSSGTAVAVYNAAQEQLVIKGERDDVDAVLAQLSFFPADKEETRIWSPDKWKVNQTTGNYADEEPPAIGDTVFSLKAYNASDILQVVGDVTFEVTEAVFGNQRPYWTANPSTEDLSSGTHDAVAGGLVDFGTISHGSDTENVQVKCEFRPYNSSTQYTGNQYGNFTLDDSIYIGDKKPAATNTTDGRFDFTGSVAEAQAFLDNVRYYNGGNKRIFDMYLTVSDGVVGSFAKKTVYFSDAEFTVPTIPDVHYVEDANPAFWDFATELSDFAYDDMPEVNTFTATITLDETGRAGCSDFNSDPGLLDVDSYNPTTGVLTLTDSSLFTLAQGLRFIQFYPVADFNSAFTMSVEFTFSNSTVGSSYTSSSQTVDVTAEEKSEVTANINSTYEWTEDQRLDFTNMFQIVHGYNHSFDVIFTLSDANAGSLFRHGSSAFFTDNYGTSAQYKLEGTRDEVNTALQNLFFAPSADYDDNFTIGITVDRTTGDLTYETQSTGTFTMNATALPDFSFPLVNPEINWENNVASLFNSGLQITDTADEAEYTPQFGSTYTVIARLKIDGSTFTHGVLTTEYSDIVTVTNDLTNEITFTGTKDNVNFVLENLTFVPDPLYEELHDFYVEYQVTRDFDGVVLEGTDFSPSVRTDFKNPTITAPYFSNRQQFDWVEDTPLEFDPLFRITETVSENTYYTPANGYDSWYDSQYKVTIRGKYWDGSAAQELPQINFTTTTAPNPNLLVSGSGTVSDPLVLQGSKSELNKAFATMKMTPATLDFTNSPDTFGGFWFEHKLERMRDSSTIINYNVNLGNFNAGTATDEYKFPTGDFFPSYIEDQNAQYIFSDLHTGDVIVDGAGDNFDATYDVTFTLQNETTGKFEAYVDEGYLEDDELNIFVNDYEIRLVGSKLDINEAIKNIQFTPYADVNTNVDIHYTQKRTYNNTTVTQANNVFAVTLQGVAVQDYVMGQTPIGNRQFFVEDRHLIGLDLTSGSDFVIDEFEENDFVTLTPRQLSNNAGYAYDAPITITDTFEDGGPSLYKVVFDGGNLFTTKNEDLSTLGASLNITDTGWQSKDTLNSILQNGIYVTGVSEANANVPEHGKEYSVTFTVYRKTAGGTETQLTGDRNLIYYFLSGLTANALTSTNNNLDNHSTRFDNSTVDIEINAHQVDNSFEIKDSIGNQRISARQYVFLPLYYQYVYIDPYVDRTSEYFVTDTDTRPHGMTLTNDDGNTIEVDYVRSLRSIYNYDNIGVLRRQVKFYVYSSWGAYLQLGADTTDSDDYRLFFRQN